MSIDEITTDAIENIIRVSQLRPATIDSLKSDYEVTAHAGAAGWHGPLDIETLAGLEGQFLWSENPFNVRTISFTFDSDKVGFQGTYKLGSGVFTLEKGVFYSIPNNPAIGYAFITLDPEGAPEPRPFTVAGMFTDDDWKIIILLLNKVGPSGPIQPPFSAVRIS